MAVVTTVAYDFAPRNWAYCNGQILAIAQNTALFSLLGTTYGGNGSTTFGLPDLRGRSAVSQGSNNLGTFNLGQMGGTETASMGMSTMPPHVHNGPVTMQARASVQPGDQTLAENNYPASGTGNQYNATVNASMIAPAYQPVIGVAGGSVPFSNLMPYITLNYVICMYGIFPSRN